MFKLSNARTVYLVHWPIAMNTNGNHPVFPTRPDGTRDVDETRDLKDTWKEMEAMVKKGTTPWHCVQSKSS